ncbi:putative reverse transcriptase domain-containing protein [Tanacetum coccineum]
MDFITKLPKTKSGHNKIWVIVDRLTKSAHFLAIQEDYSIERLARLYIDEMSLDTEFLCRSFRIEMDVSHLAIKLNFVCVGCGVLENIVKALGRDWMMITAITSNGCDKVSVTTQTLGRIVKGECDRFWWQFGMFSTLPLEIEVVTGKCRLERRDASLESKGKWHQV